MIAAQKTPWQVSKRWLPKYGIHSLRVRILLGFLLVSLTTLSIAAMGFWYQRQSAQLSRLRSLAEKARQGGQLSIHSVVGEGTRVGFELPYAVKKAAPMQADA